NARKRDLEGIAKVSAQLEAAVRDSQTANDKLRSAFDRENALADELRSERALKWILGSLAVLAMAGWLYVRFFLGGLPAVTGGLLARLEARSPQAAADA